MEIQHFSHEHPLSLFDAEERYKVLCEGCDHFTGGPAYGCPECDFNLDESCAGLPQELLHSFHPLHPLTLVARAPCRPQTFRCNACRKICRGFVYRCSDCGFNLDIDCASLSLIPPPATINDSDSDGDHNQHHFRPPIQSEHFSHHHHPHPFLVFYQKKKRYFGPNSLCCCRCGFYLRDDRIYTCLKCMMLLHKSCAELEQEVIHAFHPQHSLVLNQSPDASLRVYKCNICRNRLEFFAYCCSTSECMFRMDLKCAWLMPTLSSEIHQHPLVYLYMAPNSQVMIACSICDGLIKYPFLRCQSCNFNIHAHCFPTLPPTIKQRIHVHPLCLKVLPDVNEDGDVLYCHSCEEERVPREPIYRCLECPFESHIHCVFPEILPKLRAESPSGQEEFSRTLDRHVVKNETDEVLADLNEQIAVFEKEVKEETTQLEALTAELKELEEKHAQFATIAVSGLRNV